MPLPAYGGTPPASSQASEPTRTITEMGEDVQVQDTQYGTPENTATLRSGMLKSTKKNKSHMTCPERMEKINVKEKNERCMMRLFCQRWGENKGRPEGRKEGRTEERKNCFKILCLCIENRRIANEGAIPLEFVRNGNIETKRIR